MVLWDRWEDMEVMGWEGHPWVHHRQWEWEGQEAQWEDHQRQQGQTDR